LNQPPFFFGRSVPVLRVIQDGAVVGLSVMQEGMADNCNADVHASEAGKWQRGIACEQENCTPGQKMLFKIEQVITDRKRRTQLQVDDSRRH
jgi:hypothetical protein